jgi:nicotinamidase-related amidase
MLRREDAVLVFIDVQGKLHDIMYEKSVLDANLDRLVRCAQLLDIPVIGTEQLPGKLGPTSEPFRTLLSGAPMTAKSAFSCWGEPEFVGAFQAAGRRQAVLCGIETHVCVYQTALDLLAENFEVFVAADAVSSRSPGNKGLALESMRRAGADILPAESILFALLRDAADPRFRDVLGLVK